MRKDCESGHCCWSLRRVWWVGWVGSSVVYWRIFCVLCVVCVFAVVSAIASRHVSVVCGCGWVGWLVVLVV